MILEQESRLPWKHSLHHLMKELKSKWPRRKPSQTPELTRPPSERRSWSSFLHSGTRQTFKYGWNSLLTKRYIPKGRPDRNRSNSSSCSVHGRQCETAGESSEEASNVSYEAIDDEDRSDLVTWLGINIDWFLSVFSNLPEVQVCLEYGCEMWFIRDVGITEILRRRGATSGSLVSQLSRFSQEAAHRDITGASSAFVSYTGSYTLRRFCDLLRQPSLQGHYV